MNTVITLTTDFGQTDGYVAAMKGVILGINQEARLVDICHNIESQNISQAAFVLSTAYPYFPRKTVHLVVVDPGVGSARRAIVLRTTEADFIAPDNGVLSYVINRHMATPLEEVSPEGLTEVRLSKQVEAVELTNDRFFRKPVSATFHGRDIFAPVAALLSVGFPAIQFGPPLDALNMIPISRPGKRPDGSLVGHVLHIDGFGNLITDIKDDDLPSAEVVVDVCGRLISGISGTYDDRRGLTAVVGSSGHLEIALKGGMARALLDARIGDEITVKPGDSNRPQ
ncbi:MAG: SAM-dependent chlorinase/fluorinase [Dehalococcoidales bacterium]